MAGVSSFAKLCLYCLQPKWHGLEYRSCFYSWFPSRKWILGGKVDILAIIWMTNKTIGFKSWCHHKTKVRERFLCNMIFATILAVLLLVRGILKISWLQPRAQRVLSRQLGKLGPKNILNQKYSVLNVYSFSGLLDPNCPIILNVDTLCWKLRLLTLIHVAINIPFNSERIQDFQLDIL